MKGMTMMLSFFEIGKLKEFACFIVLLSKKGSVVDIRDCRPICLIGSVYES